MLSGYQGACAAPYTSGIRVYGGDKPRVPRPDHRCHHRAARSVRMYVYVAHVEYSWELLSIILNYSDEGRRGRGLKVPRTPLYVRLPSHRRNDPFANATDRLEIKRENRIFLKPSV